jgi:hypothetical protein
MNEDTRIALQGGVAALALLVATMMDRPAIWRPFGQRAQYQKPATRTFEGE